MVRFMTKRFIADYADLGEYRELKWVLSEFKNARSEMRYNHFTFVDNEIAYFDLLDTSYQRAIHNGDLYENKIKWGDAFIILYDINDASSFDEVSLVRFFALTLVNYKKR